MKNINKFFTLGLLISMFICSPISAKANEILANSETEELLQYQGSDKMEKAQMAFKNMSIDELNQYIDTSIKKYECEAQNRDKIINTNTYKRYINRIKNGTYSTGVGYVLTHTKSENADLYYSLHSCTYNTTKNSGKYKVSVYDYYDFSLMDYNSLFTGIVNNWAWLCQHTGVLNKINVNITFTA